MILLLSDEWFSKENGMFCVFLKEYCEKFSF